LPEELSHDLLQVNGTVFPSLYFQTHLGWALFAFGCCLDLACVALTSYLKDPQLFLTYLWRFLPDFLLRYSESNHLWKRNPSAVRRGSRWCPASIAFSQCAGRCPSCCQRAGSAP